ncbi:MAG: alpha/beta fold hydrolase [Betaproteobacteria bacterium]|nr:alpha/beta fold hydrolase [Betaproteobacteria bacterium]
MLESQQVHSGVDEFSLCARLSVPINSEAADAVALINAGAGIDSRYYERFASYLAEAGIPTLVYDYRGIGRSRPQSMRGFEASVEEWGSKDCAAVLDWLAERFPGARRIVIGHSVGGFLTGFARNGHLIDHMVLVGAHTGYWGDYAPYARPWMYLLWHAFMPAVTRLVGYFPGRWLHMLEDLPRGVALEWAARRKPDFWWNVRGADGQPDVARIDEVLGRFRSIHASVLALRFEDDPFATVAATERVLGLYSGCTAEQRLVTRANAGGQKIGHFGFFRSRFRDTLWPEVLRWLQAQGKDSRDACG